MKITKYEHACLVLEELGQKLVVDPGVYSRSLPAELTDVIAVVITHQHGDHFDKDRLMQIISINADLTVFAPQDVLEQLNDTEVKKELAEPNVSHTAGSFALEFYGKDHAIIYEHVPCMNVGVFINKKLYYPGDSFVVPHRLKIPVLALPSGAPWMKVGEAIDFMKAIMPSAVFPTHNALYNEEGAKISNNWLERCSKDFGVAWSVLKPKDSIEA